MCVRIIMSKYIEKIWTGEISPVEFTKQQSREYEEKGRLFLEKMEEFEEILDEKQNEEFQVLSRRIDTFINESAKQAFCQGFSLGSCIMAEAYINADNIGDINK